MRGPGGLLPPRAAHPALGDVRLGVAEVLRHPQQHVLIQLHGRLECRNRQRCGTSIAMVTSVDKLKFPQQR